MVLFKYARVFSPCVGGNYDTLVLQAMHPGMVLSIATPSFLNLTEQRTSRSATSPSLMFVRDAYPAREFYKCYT